MKKGGREIVFFIPSFAGGGAERLLVQLANYLAEKGERIKIVCAKKEGPYRDTLLSSIPVVDLKKGRTLACLWKLRRLLTQQQPRVLFSAQAHANIVCLLAGLGLSTKIIVQEVARLQADRAPSIWREKLVLFLIRFLYKKAYKVLTISQTIAEEFRERGFLGPVTVLPNAILYDKIVEKSQEVCEHPWLHSKSQPVLLGVGRLSPEKDFSTLIRAFALARQKRPMRLIILGEGKQRKLLEEEAKREGIQDDVSFPGFVKNPYTYYAKADGYVLSSKTEGFSFSVLEAMTCGCSVVVTPCCDIPLKLIDYGRYGNIVPIGEASQMAEGILRCLAEPTPPNVLRKQAKEYDVPKVFEKYRSALLD